MLPHAPCARRITSSCASVLLALFAANLPAAGAATAGRRLASTTKIAAPPDSRSAADGLPPLIPLSQLLLGSPKYRNPQLSPDGRYLAYLRPSNGTDVYNIFVKQLPGPEQMAANSDSRSLFDREGVDLDRQITFDAGPGVTTYTWAKGVPSSTIFYIQETADGGSHLYQASWDPASNGNKAAGGGAKSVDLSPFDLVRVSGIFTSKRFPDMLYVGMNKRDSQVFDMYRLDLKTGQLTLDTVSPAGITKWLFDYDFTIKGAEGYNATDGSAYVLIKDESNAGSPSKVGFPDLSALFKAAAARGYTYDQWVAASNSRSAVSKWRRLLDWPFGEVGGVYRFNRKGDALYLISSVGRDTAELQLVSTAPGAPILQRIASNPLVDVEGVTFDEDTWQPQLVSFDYLKTEWSPLDPEIAADWGRLTSFLPGQVPSLVGMSNDKKTWLIATAGDNTTLRYYLYRRGAWPPTLLFEVQPDLNNYKLANQHPVVITARDGLRLPAYLTLPVKPGVPQQLPPSVIGPVPAELSTTTTATTTTSSSNRFDATGGSMTPAAAAAAGAAGAAAGTTAAAAGAAAGSAHYASAAEVAAAAKPSGLNLSLPLVLLVRSSPWARDSWGGDPVGQWLANRGYAVLQVNYRGSSGFGKKFLTEGFGQWGVGAMQQDITDAVKWAVAKGIANPDKICIMGGDYGGYATLAGLTFTPELYACGVDMFGMTNLGTFVHAINPYLTVQRYKLLTRIGDVERDEALNRAISPVFHSERIRAPLLIAQGYNDMQVRKMESDQIYSALKGGGLDVQYAVYMDEAHGFTKAINKLDFYSRADQFLANHLGGRSEGPLQIPGMASRISN